MDNGFKRIFNDPMSNSAGIASAVASGAFSAFSSTAVENIILQQQLTKTRPRVAINALLKQGYSRPFVGLAQIAIREAGFAFCWLWGASATYNFVLNETQNKTLAFASQIPVGVVGALGTHPFDTWATQLQRGSKVKEDSFLGWKTAKRLYNKEGVKGFYKGGAARVGLFTGCMLVMATVQPWIDNKLKAITADDNNRPSGSAPRKHIKDYEENNNPSPIAPKELVSQNSNSFWNMCKEHLKKVDEAIEESGISINWKIVPLSKN